MCDEFCANLIQFNHLQNKKEHGNHHFSVKEKTNGSVEQSVMHFEEMQNFLRLNEY